MKKYNCEISINDGYVEYTYIVPISDRMSIDAIYQKIRRAFRAKEDEGYMRRVTDSNGKWKREKRRP